MRRPYDDDEFIDEAPRQQRAVDAAAVLERQTFAEQDDNVVKGSTNSVR